MQIVYAVQPIEGIVEFAHPPVASRVAREKLAATLDYIAIEPGLITSYTIASDKDFMYPFETPDILKMRAFFAEEDLNLVEKEIEVLYRESNREKVEELLALESALPGASDEDMRTLLAKYHYTTVRQRQGYATALESLRRTWGPWESVAADIESREYSLRRRQLAVDLHAADDCLAQAYYEEVDKLESHLTTGDREAAQDMIRQYARDWCRKNTSAFQNACGDAAFYGAGYWVARMVKNPDAPPIFEGQESNLDKALTGWKLPYFEVIVPAP